MRRSELVKALETVPAFASPRATLEQVATPADRAADLLLDAVGRGDLVGRSVLDLGCGTGRLAIGAALLGAREVTGVELDPAPLAIAERCASERSLTIRWIASDVAGTDLPADTVLMNPPFGAQTKRADRAFWTVALGRPGRAVYAFASAESRTFIEARAVERSARIEARRPVPWVLPRTFAHHRRRAVEVPVDLWVLRTNEAPP
jgi:putative methylase